MTSNKALCNKAFIIAKTLKYGKYHQGLHQWFISFIDKKSAATSAHTATGKTNN